MKKIILLIFLLLSSVNSLADSTIFVINDNSIVRSDRNESHDKNIVKIVNKDQNMQRYSGWSLVSLEGVNGWILSSSLTTKIPVSIATIDINQASDQINTYQQEIKKLKAQVGLVFNENTQLKTTINTLKLDLKDSYVCFRG